MAFETYDDDRTGSLISGKRFSVTYRLTGDEKTAMAAAEDICVEQTTEFPVAATPPGAIRDMILGRVERFEREAPAAGAMKQPEAAAWNAVISYAVELASGELTQFLNVVFGNISIKRNIQVIRLDPGTALDGVLNGPRFGVEGLRGLLGVPVRPLVFSAIKPMGLSAADMGKIAGQFALGGVDLIKDDHGLSNQVFAPFADRVKACADAVQEVKAKTGHSALYLPNITAGLDRIVDRAYQAKELGAGGVFLCPGLAGIDAVRALAGIGLPVFAHPAFLGSYAINPDGINCRVIFGTIMRMAGADAAIFPNYGGRFPLTRAECLDLASACREELCGYKPIFPCPAGGMSLDKIPDMIASYGKDTLILIGGGLFSAGGDLAANCRRFVDEVKNLA
ncbi:MAG: ribulose 1,5-bisphosphate carboxylase large subunit [Treponema sp.]|jgi:ribulose-bisphosphate carboxylase large chain|nr:ribulose 1,5-bisphosphate carboxylase large subunit [Treponema sp.]